MSISDFAANPQSDETTQDTKWSDNTEPAPTAEPEPKASPTAEPEPEVSPTVNSVLNGIMSKIQPIGQNANFKMLIYGDPGTTKSSFVAGAPNNLIVDLEDGLLSAKSSPVGIAEGVQAYPWNGFEDFTNLVMAFMQDPPELKPFQVLSIDSFSEMHKRALAEVTEREWMKRPSSNRFVPETEHHMENNERMIRMIRALRDLNRDLILTAHAKTVEPKNKLPKTYADFSESLSNKIMGMMDVVGYMVKREVEGKVVPVMIVVGDGTIHCKTRIPLPPEIVNPTYAGIKKIWEESKNK